MTSYALGDIQGCQPQMQELLDMIERESPYAKLLFAGDLVNRGPKSLDALRQVKNLEEKRNRTEPEKDPIRQYR